MEEVICLPSDHQSTLNTFGNTPREYKPQVTLNLFPRNWSRYIEARQKEKQLALDEAIALPTDFSARIVRAEAILRGLKPEEARGKRILLPRVARARDILPKTLREWGAEVDVIETYRTVVARSDARRLQEMLRQKKIDMITFTSSSTVANFAALFPAEDIEGLLSGAAVACIGPITQKTAEELGIRVDVVSRDYTIPGLTRAIVEYFLRKENRLRIED